MTLSSLPQLFVINSSVWQQQQQRKKIEIVESRTLCKTVTQIKEEKPDIESPPPDAESSKFLLIDSDTPLPEFSQFVQDRLLEKKKLDAIWGVFIEECARYYYQKFPTIQNSSEYQAIGRKMYKKYPSIKYDGKEPWSFFCKSLSQKIRHMKWKNKRRKMGLPPKLGLSPRMSRRRSRTVFHNVKEKVDRRYRPSKQYKALLKELSDGWTNESITEDRLNEILRATNKGRRTWLASHEYRKIFSLIEEFPCFAEGKYKLSIHIGDYGSEILITEINWNGTTCYIIAALSITLPTINVIDNADIQMTLFVKLDTYFHVVNDFLFLLNKPDITEMMQRLESLFAAVGAIMEPSVESSSFLNKLEILKYMEDEVAFSRTKNCEEMSIIMHKSDIPDDEMLQHVETTENSSPILYIFSNREQLQRSLVAGDKTVINTTTSDFSEAIIILIATYYTFSLDYPSSYSQILGFLQNFVVGDSYDGPRSNKFTAFMKKLNTHSVLKEESNEVSYDSD